MGDMIRENRILYYIMTVSAFSDKKGLNRREAFNYLHEYKGMEFLIECYEAEHTLSPDDTVFDLTMVCKNNGGNIE